MSTPLDNKVPPLVVVAIAALGIWLMPGLLPGLSVPGWAGVAGLGVFVGVGALVCIAGVVAFVRAKTTVNPHKPDEASELVSSGVYRVTRNPMYLGFALALVGWALFQGSLWGLVWVAAFVVYLDRFQIRPEERALAAAFGRTFEDYCARVRRWL